MKRMTLSLVTFTTVLMFMFACSQGKKGGVAGFDYTDSGLGYKFHVTNDQNPKPELGKLAVLKMTYGTSDTVFFNTNIIPEKKMKLPMSASAYPGDFYEALGMMHVGDSASFVINADSFFIKTAHFPKIPEYAVGVKDLIFNVKLENVQTEAEARQEYEDKLKSMELNEEATLKNYVESKGIKVEPTASGLYYVEYVKGNGPKPKAGDNVMVHYTGTLLDGTKFDSSVDRNQPFEFVLGQGRVIRGWDEGVAMMNVGSKATFVIPSKLGYGERGAGQQIGPYSSLVFEVELLEIVKK